MIFTTKPDRAAYGDETDPPEATTEMIIDFLAEQFNICRQNDPDRLFLVSFDALLLEMCQTCNIDPLKFFEREELAHLLEFFS